MPDYADNLAEARAKGRTGGWGHRPPVATKEVRDIARELVEDPVYQEKLKGRLRDGTAGAIEIWLWRWAYGDPNRAGEANADETDRRFKELREHVRMLIKERPHEAAQLEDRLLTGMRSLALPRSSGDERPAENTEKK